VTAPWSTPGQRWRLLAPAGTVIQQHDRGPRGRLRARRIAATGAIMVDREYIALPSLRRAIVLIEDTADALRWACRSVVAPPPGVTWMHAPIHLAIAMLRHRPGAAASLAVGRVVVGRTP
jgi:hypothetical protein